ncbi:P27 family predicted phage terminase small subunit [Nonomuraea thailandensis]|uniref:P27 family predicted phage terminase small subunit n=1 Tax=Nonomuraea thailandensis TaxID=1188745 RepID=A0A9X2GZ39_9ACTN|nr:phage terminase small subunit P27 family [Nonomuraea thailandensis]MCP2363058.1 P27 family predicted phage terminase small subunit [Nonomuraea thailandensis]
MADPHRKRPALQVVREGNPGKRPVKAGVVVPPGDLAEPDWREVFPASKNRAIRGENIRARNVARREWRRVVPVLTKTAGLGDVDEALVRDYCVCVARLDQCERAISREGMLMAGERGWQKHGATTIASAYRAQLKVYIRELGLSPSARAGITPPGDDGDDDDPFD